MNIKNETAQMDSKSACIEPCLIIQSVVATSYTKKMMNVPDSRERNAAFTKKKGAQGNGGSRHVFSKIEVGANIIMSFLITYFSQFAINHGSNFPQVTTSQLSAMTSFGSLNMGPHQMPWVTNIVSPRRTCSS